MKIKLIVGILLALFLGMVLASPVLAGGLNVSGGKIEVNVTPGSNSTHVINVQNTSDAAMNIGVDVEGYGVSSDNDFVVLSPADDTGPYSARQWLTVTPTSFSLAPGDSQNVTVTINVPAGAGAGGRYAIVMIQTIPPPGEQVATVSAIAARVLLTVNGYSVDTGSQVTGITSVYSTSSTPAGVTVTLADNGNYYFYPQISVTLMNGNTAVATGSVDTGWPVLPGYSRQYQLNLTGAGTLPAGKYEAEIEVNDRSGNIIGQSTLPVSFGTNQVLTPRGTTPVLSTTVANMMSVKGINWPVIGDIIAAVIILILVAVIFLLAKKRTKTIGN
jgi:P pilus assembly chaperone PapD